MQTTIWQADDDDSWKSMFEASGCVRERQHAQIEGLGRIDTIEQLYVEHTKAAMDTLGK